MTHSIEFKMKNKINHYMTVLMFIVSTVLYVTPAHSERLNINFNHDWQFSLDEQPNAHQPDYDDSGWRTLAVPHDWSFENGVSKDGSQGANGGYFDSGLGWYRKSFQVPDNWSNKRINIEFNGVYMNSEVWINGQYLGKTAYGYISFRHDLTKYLTPGLNVIALRVDNIKDPSARWYHPSGIYAPVTLEVTNHTYIQPNGVYVTTPKVNNKSALISIRTDMIASPERQNLYLESAVFDASGKLLLKSKQAVSNCDKTSKQCVLTKDIELDSPKLWSPASAHLYKLVSRITQQDKILDQVETHFGVRSIEWHADTGFWLNGKVTKLLGVSEHYEGGPLGGAWTKPFLKWKLSLLKDMGVNAIRTAHNPYPPMFYELCDELGIMVMDEIFDGWMKKAEFDYGFQAFDQSWHKDLTEWVKRNRNHPSIIIYSMGNETRGEEIAKSLVQLTHELDPTRPVTSGHSASDQMDVFGVNGGSEKYQFFENKRPNKPFVATEAPHTWQTRGYYRSKTWLRDGNRNAEQGIFPLPDLTEDEIFDYEWADPKSWTNTKQHFNSSYDNATVRISARKNWELMRDLPWFSGHFRWTGFDYYGEAGYVHGGWPFRLFMGGALDVAGFKKDLFYFYKSQWTDKPMVHLLPHWTHPNMPIGTKIPVWAYSNCQQVELFHNGQSLGKDSPGTKWDEMQAEWSVPWQPGTIKADCYIDGKLVTSTEQTTSGAPTSLTLKADNEFVASTRDKVAVVTAELIDAKSVFYPYGENKVYFHLEGAATIRSLENGDPVDTNKNYGVDNRKAFMGATRAFIQIKDNAKNVNLTSAAIIGDKHLTLSNKVSIDVQQLNILGATSKGELSAYYTLDGSQPAPNSQKYSKPFVVKAGSQVRAIVVQGDKVVFNMRETFADGSGLYWGNAQTKTTPQKPNQSGMLAVDAKYTGAIKSASHLDFKDQEGTVKWYQENDGEAANFSLTFIYASNDYNSQRPMDVYVNNSKIGQIIFTKTGGWNVWNEVNITAALFAGANNIELRTTGKSGPKIRSLTVDYVEGK
tara:strand:- start:504 stop:3608 length:3105 start_codon:yes stop_codon:yes gene_type:complete